jgi:hypothetical protein
VGVARTLVVAVLAAAVAAAAQDPPARAPRGQSSTATDSAVARGVKYLSVEVPKWKDEHPCYSCHNNGDAARALMVASARGYDIGNALDDTIGFLKQPAGWNQSKAAEGFDDKQLARVQFASALAVAHEHGRAPRGDLERAAKLLVADQKPDGSWMLDQSQSIASPATYGTIIATWSARRTLLKSGLPASHAAIANADKWIRSLQPQNVIDCAAVILALDRASDTAAEELRRGCLVILQSGQSREGGWGPYVTTAPQVFDTAMAVQALVMLDRPELKESIARGKDYLVRQQRPDGSWPETTRPADQESYAQRISTTGWALLALLAGS